VKRLTVHSSQSSRLDPAFNAIGSIEIGDDPIGQGGFGTVYRALRFDNRRITPQVIKLLQDNGQDSARRGFKTIQELQRRLRTKNEELLRRGSSSLLARHPALRGVPQVSFEATLDGRPVLGYSSNDLKLAGLEDFGRILEDDLKARRFQALPLTAKFKIAAELVSAFHFLNTQVSFIHADIKAEAVFVDVKKFGCAIIDFDSGALARDTNDKPTTFGTKQDWLAPEILSQLNAPGNAARAVKVDLFSDCWSINIAVHYLLFGVHPLFFLSEISDRSIEAYFQRFTWPNAAPSFRYFRREYAGVYRQYLTFLRKRIPAAIVQRFEFTINRGYLDPTARTSAGQWKTMLTTVNRPEIAQFVADRTLVEDSRPVRLSWSVKGERRLEVVGVGDVTGRAFIDVDVKRDTEFTLRLIPNEGPDISRSLRVHVSKEAPQIHAFSLSQDFVQDAKPVRLSWEVTGADHVGIDNGVGVVKSRSYVDLRARKDARFTLTAVSLFGVKATACFWQLHLAHFGGLFWPTL